MNAKPFPLLKAKEIEDLPEIERVHQFNPNAIRQTKSIGDLLGLTTLGIHLVRVEPGDETTEFHLHHQDEEFVYILEGHGIAEIGEDIVEVTAGDFMAFVQKSLPHRMQNTHASKDLVYLMGGTRSDIDICDYPRLGRRMIRDSGRKQFVDFEHLKDVP